MSVAHSDRVATELRSEGGFNASPYKRSPAGPDVFIIGNQHASMIKLWVPEHIEPEIHASKKHNQAVLHVHEDQRDITEKITLNERIAFPDRSREGIRKTLTTLKKGHLTRAQSQIQIEKPVKVQRSLAWTDRSLADAVRDTHTRLTHTASDESWVVIPVDIVTTAPESDINLLVGIDETSHFVAMLPEGVASVEEAHEALKPKRMGKTWVRQGEWFFTPVRDQKLLRSLDRSLDLQPVRSYWGPVTLRSYTSGLVSVGQVGIYWDLRTGYPRLEKESSHTAQYRVDRDDITYVKGRIVDTRTHHHRMLQLDNWHRVWRNREVTMPEEHTAAGRAPQRRYWD